MKVLLLTSTDDYTGVAISVVFAVVLYLLLRPNNREE